ncbi:MAG: amidohydrolase family protein [Kiloniellales bacterium]
MAESGSAGPILFTNVSVLDGSGAKPFAGEVLVEGNRIKAVAKGGGLARDGAELVDGGGATLIPGLIEAHAHISFCDTASLEALGDIPPEEHTLKAMKYARIMLDQGFTGLFSAAAAKPRLDVVIRNAIDEGEIPGPRMRAASPELTVTGGLGDVRRAHMYRETFAICCDGADEFRRVAREMCREGVDTLKINPSGDEFVPFARAHQTVMNEAEVAAVCEVARSRGKMTAAHARSAESVKMCLRNGVDVIYHATLCDEEALDMLEARKDQVFVAPAVGIMYATSRGEGAKWGLDEQHPVALYFRRELDMCIENMKVLKKRGLRILPGGDNGFAWNPIGTNARDLEHFVTLLGFSPLEAITAATKLGGELMQMGGELGQIRAGYLADLLLVDGNPLEDITILRDRERLKVIVKDGAFHKRAALQQRAAVAAAE